MKQALRIALIVQPTSWYDRTLIDGITAYAQEHGPWRFVLQSDTVGNRVESWLRAWKPDGVLARITGLRMARQLRHLGVPIVDLLEETGGSHIPRVVCDSQEAVRRAVDHLLDRHLRHLAYVGRRGRRFSDRRLACFREYVTLRQRAMKCGAGGVKPTCASMLLQWKSMPHLHVELADWLRSLPKPVGIVACNDVWGSQVLRVCREYDLHVPEEIAVIGIDADPVMCQMSTPPLSSIGANAHVIGYRAAAMLQDMISHDASPPALTFVEPGPVRARQSTDMLAIADAEVAGAVRFLRAHACERLTPETAAVRLGISRRTLTRMFIQHVGHSPTVEITRARLERARELLLTTDLPLPSVARRAGLLHVETLHRLFRKWFGFSPGEYRHAHGPKAGRHSGVRDRTVTNGGPRGAKGHKL